MSNQGALAHEHVSTLGTLALKHESMQGTLALEHVSTQGTVPLEHVSTQGTLAHEYVSMQDTLAREHVVSMQGTQFRRLCLQGLMLFIFLLKNFNAGKENVFVEKIEFLNSVEDQVFATVYR